MSAHPPCKLQYCRATQPPGTGGEEGLHCPGKPPGNPNLGVRRKREAEVGEVRDGSARQDANLRLKRAYPLKNVLASSILPSVHPFIQPSTHLSMHPASQASIHASLCPSIHPPIHQPPSIIYPFTVHPSIPLHCLHKSSLLGTCSVLSAILKKRRPVETEMQQDSTDEG